MSYEVIIDISDVERRSFDFKRMFDESIPCKERIVRCRDCKCRRDWTPEELSGFDEAQVADGWCRFIRIGVDDSDYCSWGERIDAQPERLRGEGEC